MKKILTLALGTSLLAGAAMGMANAQGAASGPFADVPTDHWAYSSVEKLRDAGIVIGYPDGTYGGHRPMTRYEFAAAIARLLPLIKNVGNVAPTATGPDMNNYYTKSDVDGLLAGKASQASVDQLRSDLTAKLQQNSDALDNLTKLVNQFQPELQQLGVDVAAVKAQLKSISDRLAAVEAEQARVHITGAMSSIARSDIYSSGGGTVLDADGYPIGSKAIGNKSVFAQPEVYNDILLNIVGRVSDNAQAVIRMDIGNYAGFVGSETADIGGGAGAHAAANSPIPTAYNLYEAYLQSPVSLGPLSGASVTVGRFGEQFTSLTYKAVNPDSYASLEQTASGNVIGDGAALRFGIGPVKLNAFATKTDPSNAPYTLGGAPNALNTGFRPGSAVAGGATWTSPYDQTAGVRAVFGTPSSIEVGLTGVLARTANPVADPQTGKTIRTIGVYGADVQGGIPFLKTAGLTFKVEGDVATTGSGGAPANVNKTKGNEAFEGQIGYTAGGLSVSGGYNQIYANYCAPGYWDHLGTWTNPTNVEGAVAHASYAFTPKVSIYGEGNIYQGISKVGFSPLYGTGDKLNHYEAGVKFAVLSGYTADLGYEWLQYKLQGNNALNPAIGAGKPVESYINFGIGHTLTANASVKVLYQIIDYNGDNTNFDPSGNKSHGGVALTQFDLKF